MTLLLLSAFLVSLFFIHKLKKQLSEVNEKLNMQIKEAEWKAKVAKELMHDIRNPIAAISTTVQYLSFVLPLTEENKKLMDSAVSYSEYLNKILSDYLMVTSVNDSAVMEKVNLVSVVDTACSLIKAKAKIRSIELQVNVQEEKINVKSNFSKLNQVIFSLLYNCVKSSEEDSKIEIDLAYSLTPGYAELKVRDTAKASMELDITDKLAKCLDISIQQNQEYADGNEYVILIPVTEIAVSLETQPESLSLSL